MEDNDNNKNGLSLSVNPRESEDCMSTSDVEDLIIAGHLGMLLGCLAVGGKKEEVSVALDSSTYSLDQLVRVLHAYLSLHQHAEVLSTDIAVPILTLIRNLEDNDNCTEEGGGGCSSQGLRTATSSQDDVKYNGGTAPSPKRVKTYSSLLGKKEDDDGVGKLTIPVNNN